jgi:hypothetical protein
MQFRGSVGRVRRTGASVYTIRFLHSGLDIDGARKERGSAALRQQHCTEKARMHTSSLFQMDFIAKGKSGITKFETWLRNSSFVFQTNCPKTKVALLISNRGLATFLFFQVVSRENENGVMSNSKDGRWIVCAVEKPLDF